MGINYFLPELSPRIETVVQVESLWWKTTTQAILDGDNFDPETEREVMVI